MNNDDKLREAVRYYNRSLGELQTAQETLSAKEKEKVAATGELIRVMLSQGMKDKPLIYGGYTYTITQRSDSEPCRLTVVPFCGQILS